MQGLFMGNDRLGETTGLMRKPSLLSKNWENLWGQFKTNVAPKHENLISPSLVSFNSPYLTSRRLKCPFLLAVFNLLRNHSPREYRSNQGNTKEISKYRPSTVDLRTLRLLFPPAIAR